MEISTSHEDAAAACHSQPGCSREADHCLTCQGSWGHSCAGTAAAPWCLGYLRTYTLICFVSSSDKIACFLEVKWSLSCVREMMIFCPKYIIWVAEAFGSAGTGVRQPLCEDVSTCEGKHHVYSSTVAEIWKVSSPDTYSRFLKRLGLLCRVVRVSLPEVTRR